MCLAIPGKIVEIKEDGTFNKMGKVSFGGIIKNVNLSLVPSVKIDEYVIVHAGVALNVLDETEASKLIEEIRQLEDGEDAIPN